MNEHTETETRQACSDRLSRLLEHPDTEHLVWSEPWPGTDASGNKMTADVQLRASVADCICMARTVAEENGAIDQPDRELLLEFMAVHWADKAGDVGSGAA